MKCQILFSGKNKKNNIILSSAENAQRVVKVKDDTYLVHPNHLLLQSKSGHHLECIVLKEYKENQKQRIVQTLKE